MSMSKKPDRSIEMSDNPWWVKFIEFLSKGPYFRDGVRGRKRKRAEYYVLTSFSLLRKCETLASRAQR